MNIVTDLIGGDISLTAEMLRAGGPFVLASACERVAREMDAEARERGFEIVAEDVHVWKREQNDYERAREIMSYAAVWAPDPMGRGVELFGGSHDGEILHVAREEGPGRSMPRALLSVLASPPTDIETGQTGPMPDLVPVEEYLRAGIDSTNRRFIYKIKVSQ